MTILSILYILSKSLTFLHSLTQSRTPSAQRANKVHQSSEVRLSRAPLPGRLPRGSGLVSAHLTREGGEPVEQVLHLRNLLANVNGGLVVCFGEVPELLLARRQ